MLVRGAISVRVLVGVFVCEVYIELRAGDAHLLAALDVHVPPIEVKVSEFALHCAGVHTKINQRADEHIAADATENIEIKRLHGRPDLQVASSRRGS